MAENWTTTDWTVIAYVGPQTNTDGDRCVHLYPDLPGGAKFHCVTVWEERFNELPYGIGEEMMTASIIAGTAPSPEQAKAQGIWQPCAPFQVQTWVREDGAKMKKLAHIVGPVVGSTPQHSVPARRSLEQAVQGLEWNPVPLDEVAQQFGVIAAETMKKLDTLMQVTDIKNMVIADADDMEQELTPALGWGYSLDWNKFIFSLAWRDVNDQYRVVRPALLAPASMPAVQVPDPDVILQGRRADFLQDVADQHEAIHDDEQAKKICKTLQIKGSAEEASMRVTQAKRIWLYVDLLRQPYSLSKQDAAKVAGQAYPEEVPF